MDTSPTLSTTPLFTAGATQFRGLVYLVPEPTSALVALGLGGLVLRRRR